MVQCHVCEIMVGDDELFCPEGHALDPAMSGVVAPAVHPDGAGTTTMRAEGSVVQPDDASPIRLVTMERSSAEGFLSEALGALAEDIHPASAASPPPRSALPDPADASDPDQPMEEDHMLVPPDLQPEEDVAAAVAPVMAAPPAVAEQEPPSSVLVGAELFAKPVRAPARPRRTLMVVPLIIAVLAGAGAFVVLGGDQAEAATYRRLFTPKEKHRYSFEIAMDGAVEAGPARETMKMGIAMVMSEQTLAVDQAGVATIRQTIESMELRVNGERAPVPDLTGITITVRMAPDGKVVSVDGLESLGFGQAGPATDLLGPNSFGPLLPSDAVAPGDEWTVVEELPTPFGQPMKLTARNRLVQRGAEGGVETALIRSELDMPMNLRVGIDELLEMAGESSGLADAAGLPRDAEFVYDGGMKMDLLQTVVVATGRPLTVSGSGTGDIGMSIKGMRGMPSMRMRFSISATMAELRGPSRARGSAFSDPVLTA